MRRLIVTARNNTFPLVSDGSAARCLGAAEQGRLAARPTAGRAPSSGTTPVARAAGDLPRFVGPKTHTVKRSVHGLSASHSPAAEMPPNALPGTFADKIIDALTVIAGLAVFWMIALFLLVIS